jgi:hypothetical protein
MYLEPDIFRTSLPSDEAAPLAAGTGANLTDADEGADSEAAPEDAAAAEVPASAETRAGGPVRSE